MRKNLLIALAVITCMVISLTSCILGEDVDTLEQDALKTNLGLTAVSIADIQGITALADNTPVKNIDSEQYTGTVKWSPEDATFKLDIKYTATITLTPKSNYTFKSLKANFFTVAGAESAANSKNSGVITAVFPPAKYGINIAAIEGVTAPSPGGVPKTVITGNDQYSGTVTWSPAVSGTFVRNTQYTATITLTPKPNYTLQGVAANFFTVAGAESATNNANSGVITAIFPPAEPPTLTAGVWADGNITTSSSEQWFKFTATSNTNAYIHASFGTLNSSNGFYVQVYDSTGREVSIYDSYNSGGSSSSYKRNLGSSNRYIYLYVTSGQTYYIKVTPYTGYTTGYTGTYQIAFNTSSTPPSPTVTLTADTWANGSVSSNGEQWYQFTATASTQYIHVNFAPLNSSTGIYVQLYDSTRNNAVGSQTRLNNSNTYTSQSVTSGQVYYIKVTPSNYSSSAFWIVFSASSTAPSSNFNLTAGVWTDGNISANGEQWFKFTATAYTQYIHVASTLNLNIQVYDSNGSTVGSQTTTSNGSISRSVTSGQVYYIKVTLSNSTSSGGKYQIAFNTSYTRPLPSDSTTATTLSAGTWGNGNITSSGGVQWFKFTATSDGTQYIHISFGSLNDLYVQVYNSDGSTVLGQTNLMGPTKSASLSVSSGQVYYIKVWPYSSSGSGTYKIAFNTSSTPPSP